MNASPQTLADARPSRTAAGENFPVGSWLLPAPVRPTVAAFYRFARAADDVADSPDYAPATKIELLDAMEAGLLDRPAAVSHPGVQFARDLRAHLLGRGITLDHPRHLLEAFRADALNRPCRTWSDLFAYCRFSAAPVGRFLLDLHGEDRNAYPAADALCAALQVLNHIQDCQADYRHLKRVYIPTDWLAEEGVAMDALLAPRCNPGLRRVLDRVLDRVDALNAAARGLPTRIRQRGLRMEATAIVIIAHRLAGKLRRHDPLQRRVVLSRATKLGAMLAGAIRGWPAP